MISSCAGAKPAPPFGLIIGSAVVAGVVFDLYALLLIPPLVVLALLLSPASRVADLAAPLIVAIVACLLGSWRSVDVVRRELDPDLVGSAGGVGVVEGMPQSGGSGERVAVRVIAAGTGQSTFDRVIVFLPRGMEVNDGDHLQLTWSLQPVEMLDPGFAEWVRSQDASAVAYVRDVEVLERGSGWQRGVVDLRRVVSHRLRHLIPGDAGALASGIVTGDDAALSDDVTDLFRRTGLAHITAVSGQNVAMLLALAFVFFPARLRRRSRLLQAGMIALVMLYAAMVGLNAPALRAALFAAVVIVAASTGRRPDLLTALALVTAAMVMVEPQLVWTVSFWLSVAASAALVTTVSVEVEGGVSGRIVRGLLALVAAQLATVPITVAVFGTWSAGSVVANLLVAPLIELAFPLVFMLAVVAVALPFAAPWLAWIPEIVLDLVIDVATRVDRTFHVIDLSAAAGVANIAILMPCCVGLAVMSVDVQRTWERSIETGIRRIAAAIAGVGLGIAMAVMVTMLRGALH